MNPGGEISHPRPFGARIGPPLLIAVAVAAVALWAAAVDAGWIRLVVDCALGWSLLALAWIDWEAMLLPDALTLPLTLAGLGVTLDQDKLRRYARR